MKIGIIHSYYSSEKPSGENMVVDDIIEKLSSEFDVTTWVGRADSKLLSKSSILFLFRHMIFDYRKKPFEKWLFLNDEVQIHNNFPLLTRANLKSLSKYAESHPVVRIVHNYRTTCLRGSHFRNGSECHLCSQKSFSPGVIRRCFRGSSFLSVIVAANTKFLTRIILKSKSSLFVGVSHQISGYIQNSTQSDVKIETILNKIDDSQRKIEWTANEVLYLGRLDPEKDILKFLNKWVSLLGLGVNLPKLNIVGSGEQEKFVKEMAKNFPKQITVHGYLKDTALEDVMKKCKIFVFTSAWKEPFGRTLIEAASRGMFLIGVENPILRTLIDTSKNGLILAPDYSNLEECVDFASKTDSSIHQEESRSRFRQMYANSGESSWVQFYRNRSQ